MREKFEMKRNFNETKSWTGPEVVWSKAIDSRKLKRY